MRSAKDRGFSLLVVLLVLVVLAIIGVTTVSFSITEAGTAGARVNRRQALSAAEAGVNHFMGLSQPATPNADGFFIGNAGTGVDAWQWLPTVKGPRGEVLQPRYQVVLAPTQPAVSNSRLVEVRGEVVIDGRTVSRALLNTLVETVPGGGGGPIEQGQKSTGPLGGSSTIPIVSNISLDFT